MDNRSAYGISDICNSLSLAKELFDPSETTTRSSLREVLEGGRIRTMFYVTDFCISEHGVGYDDFVYGGSKLGKGFMSQIYFSNERQLLEFVQSVFDVLGNDFCSPPGWSSAIGLPGKVIFNCPLKKSYAVYGKHPFYTEDIYYIEYVQLTMAFTCVRADILRDNPPLAILDERYPISAAYKKHLDMVREELRGEIINAFYMTDIRYGKE